MKISQAINKQVRFLAKCSSIKCILLVDKLNMLVIIKLDSYYYCSTVYVYMVTQPRNQKLWFLLSDHVYASIYIIVVYVCVCVWINWTVWVFVDCLCVWVCVCAFLCVYECVCGCFLINTYLFWMMMILFSQMNK